MIRRKRKNVRAALLSGLVLATLSWTAWALLWPVTGSQPAVASKSNEELVRSLAIDSAAGGFALDAAIWQRRLQGWVVEADTQALAPSPSSVPFSSSHAGVRLVGTIIETGNSFAMLVDRHGTIDCRPAGAILQLDPPGIRVDSIASGSAVVSYNGRSETLALTGLTRDASIAEEDSEPVIDPDPGESQEAASMQSADELSMEDEFDWLNGTPAAETSGAAARRSGPGAGQ